VQPAALAGAIVVNNAITQGAAARGTARCPCAQVAGPTEPTQVGSRQGANRLHRSSFQVESTRLNTNTLDSIASILE
jgi:hypothetical protein